MQGKRITIIDARDKIRGFQTKLDLWTRRIQKGIHANFLTFHDWKVNKSGNKISDLEIETCQHLSVLKTSFDDAIFNDNAPWITHRFEAKLESIADDDMCKDELIDLQSSTSLYFTFISCNDDFIKFWCGLVEGFSVLTKRALEVIVPFSTTYLFEAGFSSLMTTKTKQRSPLVAKDDI